MIGAVATLLAAGPSATPDWAVLAPLVVLSLVLLVYCLVDLARRPAVSGGNKLVWLAIIILLGTLGQIAYLVVGRNDGRASSRS